MHDFINIIMGLSYQQYISALRMWDPFENCFYFLESFVFGLCMHLVQYMVLAIDSLELCVSKCADIRVKEPTLESLCRLDIQLRLPYLDLVFSSNIQVTTDFCFSFHLQRKKAVWATKIHEHKYCDWATLGGWANTWRIRLFLYDPKLIFLSMLSSYFY